MQLIPHLRLDRKSRIRCGDESDEGDEVLLDRTMVLYGNPMDSAKSHSNVKLPVLLAGGDFQHGKHHGFDKDKNDPLANLSILMLHRLGIDADKLASSNGTMRGFEITLP